MENKNVKDAKGTCGPLLSDAELKKLLAPEQYRIMRQNGTELPFKNKFWDNKRDGIYVDAITGQVLFSSRDKFASGTGWPSFTRPLKEDAVIEQPDTSHGMARTEVRSASSGSHLGHVFKDGPAPGGLRYCINSAALRFIPVEEMARQGYGRYLTQTAVFGAGCFWGAEEAFRRVEGVLDTRVGFMGGKLKNPGYKDVSGKNTGHAEVVRVEYDPVIVSYARLLEVFWSIHDPTTLNQQGPDVGSQYRSVIFYSTPEQERAARALKEKLEKSGNFKRPVVTEIVPAGEFYAAEEYHQRYYEKRGIKSTCYLPRL